MKNILLVANWESGVGYAWWLMENFWAEIAQHFSKQGHEVFLIYPQITSIPTNIQQAHINILEYDYRQNGLKDVLQLGRLIKKHNIGYLYLTDKPFISPKYAYLHLLGVKQIIVHDHTPGERDPATGLKRTVKSVVNRLPLLPADHLIAVTDYVRDRFLNTYCWPKDRCSVAPNGIRPLSLSPENKHYAHQQFNIPINAQIIISTGRANRYKRIDFIIECANELINQRKIENLYFLYCGDGPDIGYFKELATSFSLDEHFIFAGNRNDVPKLLQSATIGLHAAKGEVGYSLSILEYMSAGLVTLVPDNPSVNGAINHGTDGYLYPEGDIKKVTDIIEMTIKDRFVAESIANNATLTVKHKFNLEQTNQALIRTLDRLINGI